MSRIYSFWLVAAGMVLCAVTLLASARQVVNDARFTAVQTELGFWGREGYQPTEATRAKTTRNITRLLDSQPHHPDYLSAQANDAAWRAYWSKDRKEVAALLQQATHSQQMAVNWRPARPQDRLKLNEYQRLLEQVQ